MSDTATELAAFQHYATVRLGNGGSDLSLDELFDEWRQANPNADQLLNSTRAIAASLRDLENGETGRPAEEVLNELQSKYGSCG